MQIGRVDIDYLNFEIHVTGFYHPVLQCRVGGDNSIYTARPEHLNLLIVRC